MSRAGRDDVLSGAATVAFSNKSRVWEQEPRGWSASWFLWKKHCEGVN
jgi:hypothetical protein